MIEPTDEMRTAVTAIVDRHAADDPVLHGRMAEVVDEALAVALALIERDYHVTLRADMPYKGWLIEHVKHHADVVVEGCTFCTERAS